MKSAWRKIVEQVVADPRGVLDEIKRYVKAVEDGADPIEALHGHICGPNCWHNVLKPKRDSK